MAPKQPPKSLRSPLQRISDTCSKAADQLDECVERVKKLLSDPKAPYDKDLASHLVWLTKNLASIGDSFRKMESHEAKNSELAPATVLEWMRKLTPAQRAQWLHDIRALDRKGSVLG